MRGLRSTSTLPNTALAWLRLRSANQDSVGLVLLAKRGSVVMVSTPLPRSDPVVVEMKRLVVKP